MAVRPPFHHLGYVVPDLESAAERLSATLGAGPFLHIGHVPLEGVTYRGQSAVYDHSTAFGQWGPTLMEISQIHTAEPRGLHDFFTSAPPPAIGHVAWLVDDIDAESAELERQGLALVHTGHSGPVQAHWHDGRALLGHPVEVLKRGPEVLGFYETIKAASRNWDGSRPLRDAPGPPPA